MASSLIASIDAALLLPHKPYYKIALRRLKLALFCVRNLDGDDERLRSLFTRIESAIPEFKRDRQMITYLSREMEDLVQASLLVSLTPEDVVGIADCFLENSVESLHLTATEGYIHTLPASYEANADILEAQIRSLKNFLLFAMHSGATDVELESFLLRIQPIAVIVAGLFGSSDAAIEALLPMLASPQLYEAYIWVLTSSKSRPMDYDDVLDSLVSLLWDVLRLKPYDHPIFAKDHLKQLYERLRFSRRALRQHPCGKIKDQIGVLVFDAGVFICSLYQEDVRVDLGLVSDLVKRFDDVLVEAQVPEVNELKFSDSTSITEDVNSVKLSEENGERGEEIATQSDQLPSKSALGVVGFKEDELTSILNQLTGGISKQLGMVAISGMAGIGKTTLALKVFNIASGRFNFQAFAWCTISQVLEKTKVFVQLLNQIQPGPNYSQMNEDDLANKLRQSLKGKKYLILLDDVWTSEAWDILAGSFPDDSAQSRILLTSRQQGVAPRGLLVNGESVSLRLREDHECLEILTSKLFPEKVWPLQLVELGKRIAEKCKGLPLTATLVAGLLATTKQDDWKGILNDLSSSVVSGAEQCNNSIELSYSHLPDELRLCFLYFGVFPEDYTVHVSRLIRLWMAERLVKMDSLKSTEDVARGYLNGLIKRNLVMIAEKSSIGRAKTCQIHDVLHEFCVKKAKQERFFHLLLQRYDQLSNFNEPSSLQRLCIHSEPIHFKKSMPFCPRAKSVVFFSTQDKYALNFIRGSFIFQIFKFVEVLEIGQIVLDSEISNELQFLTQLKYLSFKSSLTFIPAWIGNLSNLETFIAELITYEVSYTSLPHTFWNLQKLKYLQVIPYPLALPIENLDSSLVLSELDTLVGVAFDRNLMEKQMRKIPNIRRLDCEVSLGSRSRKKFTKIVIPDFLNQLESLTVGGKGKLICEFGSSVNLRKVNLSNFELSSDAIASIGKLHSLEILKLESVSFSECTLEMGEGEFSKLRVLELYDREASLRWWTCDELPCFQKLVLRNCFMLREIPSFLETISTLEKIQLIRCSSLVEESVRDMEKVQNDYGNPVQVRIAW